MEHRKLIKFGNSSFIVSLPNDWIKKNRLKKGDLMYYTLENDGIKFYPEFKEEKELKEANIELSENMDLFRRELISVYIDGYNVVKIKGRNLETNIKNIRNILRNLTSFEIIKQTPELIVVQDFFNIKEVNLKDLIKRMDIITRSMIEDSIEGIVTKENKYEILNDKDTDVNRLSFMLFRVIKSSLKDSLLASKLNMDNLELLDNWLLVVNIEKIADEAKRISRFLRNHSLKVDERKELIKLYNKVKDNYYNAITAYYNNNKKLAKEVYFSHDILIEECNKYFNKYNKGVLGSVVEKLKGFVVHTKEISRIVYS